MASGTWIRQGFYCATTAEAWGIYQAMIFSIDCGFRNVQFESDCEKVIKLLQGTGEIHKNYLGTIIESILSLQICFSHCVFSHVRRNGNRLPHFMAQLAISVLDKVWMEDVPSNALPLYYSDLI